MARHESRRWCARCARKTRHRREDLIDFPHPCRWTPLRRTAPLVNALLCRWSCLEHDQADDYEEPEID